MIKVVIYYGVWPYCHLAIPLQIKRYAQVGRVMKIEVLIRFKKNLNCMNNDQGWIEWIGWNWKSRFQGFVLFVKIVI